MINWLNKPKNKSDLASLEKEMSQHDQMMETYAKRIVKTDAYSKDLDERLTKKLDERKKNMLWSSSKVIGASILGGILTLVIQRYCGGLLP
jgi:isopenicillin N synthase-like dioxygenase